MITREVTYSDAALGIEVAVDFVGGRYIVSVRDTDAEETLPTRQTFFDRTAAIKRARSIAMGVAE